MSTLVPRLWSGVADWFDLDLTTRVGMIRLEDHMTDSEYTIRAELPGMDPEKDVQVSVSHGMLTIHAERKDAKESRNRTEFWYGLAQRTVRLPANADEENVKARYGKGILEITVPLKAAEPTAKQIPVEKES